jgi:hypothetical protein
VESIISDVLAELERARSMWPHWPVDPIHAAAVVSEEAGELVQAANDYSYSGGDIERMRAEATQTTAMGLRFLAGLAAYERRRGIK